MTNRVKQSLIIIYTVFFGAIFCYYTYLFKPLNDRYKDAANRLNLEQTKLASLRIRVQDLPKLKAETEMLHQEVDRLAKLLPQHEEIPGLLRIITKRAQKNELQINTLSPGKISSQQNLNEIPFQVYLKGRYHSLARFLADIGQEARIISVRDLNMTYFGSTNKKEQHNLSSDFVLLSYTYSE